jgi:hypothetical protein
MSASRTITLGTVMIVACATIFLVSCLFMSLRISDHYRAAPPPGYLLKSIDARTFPLWGRQVTFTDAKTDDPPGRAALRIQYGDSELTLPVHRPKVPSHKDLGAYDEWLAVAAFAKLERGSVPLDLDLGQAKDFRVALVKRNAAPGHDDEMGGLVGRKLWTFDIIEFEKDGSLTQRRLQFPSVEYMTGKEYLPALRADPQAKVEPIGERSWEFQLALLAIPRLHISNYRYRHTAVSAMGWTFPAAGFSMMGLVAGIAVMQIGRIGRRQELQSASVAPTFKDS